MRAAITWLLLAAETHTKELINGWPMPRFGGGATMFSSSIKSNGKIYKDDPKLHRQLLMLVGLSKQWTIVDPAEIAKHVQHRFLGAIVCSTICLSLPAHCLRHLPACLLACPPAYSPDEDASS